MLAFTLALALALSSSDAGTQDIRDSEAVAATRFVHGAPPHGVPGPWALCGFRMGAHALKHWGLTRERSFELTIEHRSPQSVRYTCMADGVMAATGASPGKLNLALKKVATEDELETVITHKKSKRQLIFRLTRKARDHMRDIDYADFPGAATWLEAQSDEALFTVVEKAL